MNESHSLMKAGHATHFHDSIHERRQVFAFERLLETRHLVEDATLFIYHIYLLIS